MSVRALDPAPRTAAAIREAREAWPDVEVSGEAFEAYLDAREGALSLHLRDLVLACACAGGDARAHAVFDRLYLAPLADVVARAGFPAHVGADVTQILRERLLGGGGGATPRITEFRGRASLASWLRVSALREAGKVRRHEKLHAGLRPDAGPPPATPEEATIRARYGEAFERAFADAFRALPAEDRLALRLHFTDGLNLDALAAAMGFSRATAGRRLLLARTRLKEETMRTFGERLSASGTEMESALRVIRSVLELSFDSLVTSV